MKSRVNILGCFLGLSLTAAPAAAATFSATSANLKAVFAAAGAGDTIKLSGDFGTQLLGQRRFSSALKIDARNATFSGALTIDRVEGLTITGGRFGATPGVWQNGLTVRVWGGKDISFVNPQVFGDGGGKARGIGFRDTIGIAVTGGEFTGLRQAIGISGVTNGLFDKNRITASTSDGFNIVNSHFITASNNICSGGKMSVGAHPDCIQLWSLAGQPVQSDIRIINNKAYGRTQGFTSFDPDRGGGLRIEMSGNYVETSFPNGIACYACVDSRFTDNILRTEPGSKNRTKISIIGGSNNFIDGNDIGAYSAVGLPPQRGNVPSAAGFLDVQMAEDAGRMMAFSSGDGMAALAGVPEPMMWAQMLAGFAAIGVMARRRARVTART